ncbi:DUF4251 domain-containing protein [uncultured Winogradskyella sp.]|uniref:DUF4251 domain-containing protein n=1 Tax=uncultured Winogradskyella sp. TaxID=395353 RepID=UPI00261611E3|nr:DUF4251 domain-containing protein [uncultured Winogradskyella sp.]
MNHTYKRLQVLLCFGLICLVFSCKSNDTAMSSNSTLAFSELETLLEKEDYYIEMESAIPFNTLATTQVINSLMLRNTGNNASRIDLSGDGNFIEIKNDSIKGYLPFFGEQRISSGRYGGTDTAIQFEGLAKDYEKSIIDKKKKLEIEFTTNHKGDNSERYDVRLEIFPNKRVMVSITPTYRTIMRYSGRLKPIKDKSQ